MARTTDLALLHPVLRNLVPPLQKEFAAHPTAVANGWYLIVGETWRSPKDQAAGAAKGTSTIDGKTAWGLHQYFPAYAVDMWVVGNDGKVVWNKKEPWELLRKVGKLVAAKAGTKLRFGSDFNGNDINDDKLYDGPHIELGRDYLRRDLQRGLAAKKLYPVSLIDGVWGKKCVAGATTLGLPTGGADSPELSKALDLPHLTQRWYDRSEV